MDVLTLEYGYLNHLSSSDVASSTNEAKVFIPILHEGRIIMIDPEQSWYWTDEWQAGERRVDEYIRNGDYDTFDTMEEFLRTLRD